MNKKNLFETDEHAWIFEQINRLDPLDVENIDTSNLKRLLEDLAKSDRSEIRSRLIVLLMHLLKFKYQPNMATNSWRNTVLTQRRQILEKIEESGTLRNYLKDVFNKVYPKAREDAVIETGLPEKTFPKKCPFSLKQVLDPKFFGGQK